MAKKKSKIIWWVLGIIVVIVLLVGGGIIGGFNLGWFEKNECSSDSQCPTGAKCSLVIMADEFQFYKRDIQKCVMDNWECHLCSPSQKPNYYELCCDNLS